MSYSILSGCKRFLAVAVFFGLGVRFAPASNTLKVSGFYEVVQSAEVGAQEQIRLHIHLVNHGPSVLSIQRITLWDLSHPEKGGTSACEITLPARASADTTQEFTIQRAEYQMWQKGLRPRLVLQMPGPGNTRSTTVVRLDRTGSKEAK